MKLYLIAGEASGDKLGASLMQGLKTLHPNVQFYGIGGPLMGAEGLTSLFPMEELSVMGLSEVLPKLRGLFKRRDQAAAEIIQLQPDALITIDSPDFCLRVAKKVKAAAPKLPVIHYVAPSVWIWRPGRADKMAQYVDHVLALLPFEPPYMEAAGMTCDFVGHPVTSEPNVSQAETSQMRDMLQIGDQTMLLVLPGSRRGEVERLSDIFKQTLMRVPMDNVHVVIPAAGHVCDLVREKTSDWPFSVTVLDPRTMSPIEAERRKQTVFASADLALAASGTVGLELGKARCPTVVGYRMAPITSILLDFFLKVKFVNLINILVDRLVVPEFSLRHCTAQNLSQALTPLLTDPDARAAQIRGMDEAIELLGEGGEPSGLRAARSVLNHLK